jgi:phosphopantetheinyl transferase
MSGEERGPAVSFSTCGGKLWAALSGDESEIGIDVAGSDEFQAEYPQLRVFRSEEIHHALKLTNGDLEEASALLWSIKEAVVKALGCAFHLVEPRHVSVFPSVDSSGGGYTFPVGLSGKAQERYPLIARRPLWVRSLPQQKQWCSIALVDRNAIDHE